MTPMRGMTNFLTFLLSTRDSARSLLPFSYTLYIFFIFNTFFLCSLFLSSILFTRTHFHSVDLAATNRLVICFDDRRYPRDVEQRGYTMCQLYEVMRFTFTSSFSWTTCFFHIMGCAFTTGPIKRLPHCVHCHISTRF